MLKSVLYSNGFAGSALCAGLALSLVLLQAQPVQANGHDRSQGDLPFSAGTDNFGGFYYSFSIGGASGGVSAPNAEPWAQDRPLGDGLSYGFSVGHNWQTDGWLVGLEARALATHDLGHVGYWAPGSLTFETPRTWSRCMISGSARASC